MTEQYKPVYKLKNKESKERKKFEEKIKYKGVLI